jgi:hypothetical protein
MHRPCTAGANSREVNLFVRSVAYQTARKVVGQQRTVRCSGPSFSHPQTTTQMAVAVYDQDVTSAEQAGHARAHDRDSLDHRSEYR